MKKADAILTADWHLMDTVPSCRIDDFLNTQWKKVDFIRELHHKHKCPVICAGDLYHTWKPSPYLIAKTMKHLPEDFICIAGNHDLPANSFERIEESGINVLNECDYLNVEAAVLNHNFSLSVFHFGMDLHPPSSIIDNVKEIAVIHQYIYKGKKPFPGATNNVKKFIKKLSGYDLIVSGDNHLPFIHKQGKQLLVNPGSLTRHKADQVKHRPRVYLWYAETNTVEAVFLPCPRNAVSRHHIKNKKIEDEWMLAFAKKVTKGVSLKIDFEDNMKRVIQKKKIKTKVANKIKEAMNG